MWNFEVAISTLFQTVTDADVGAIKKNDAGNFSLPLAIYNLHNLQFMLQSVLMRSLNAIKRI